MALAVLAVGCVFSATVAMIQWRRADDLRHTESVRRAAASTAARFAVALFTYDSADLEAAKARVLRYATPAFAKRYSATNGPEQKTIADLGARESARVTGVFLTDVVRDRAAAVVVVDATAQSKTGTHHSLDYLDVAMVWDGKTWKVNASQAVPVKP
jgi:hypothetical protein